MLLAFSSCIVSEVDVDIYGESKDQKSVASKFTTTLSSQNSYVLLSDYSIIFAEFSRPVINITQDQFEFTNGTISNISKVNDTKFILEVSPELNKVFKIQTKAGLISSSDGKIAPQSNMLEMKRVAAARSLRAEKGLINTMDDNGTVNVKFVLDGILEEDVTVSYLVTGEAVYGVNHDARPDTVVIPKGSTEVQIPVQVYDIASGLDDTSLRISVYAVDSSGVGIDSWNYFTEISIENEEETSRRKFKSIFQPFDQNICGINLDDELICWGRNDNGFLGVGHNRRVKEPTNIDPGEKYLAVSNAYWSAYYLCGITLTNDLKCWGNDRIGDGIDHSDYATPTVIMPGTKFNQVVISRNSAYAITTTGDLYAWGENSSNYLGDNSSTDQLSPVLIDSGQKYKMVAARQSTTCGITDTDDLKCWGNNSNGMVGDGTTTNVNVPTIIDSGVKYQDIQFASGYSNHVCGLTTGGQVKCWGYNGNAYEAGHPSLSNVTSPYLVDSTDTYKSITVGEYNNCGITSFDKVKCWGSNWYGEQGNLDYNDSATPSFVDGDRDFKKVFFGGHDYSSYYYCGITTSDLVYCWGYNGEGQMGIGEQYDDGMYQVPTSRPVISIAMSLDYYDMMTCFLYDNYEMECAGYEDRASIASPLYKGTTFQKIGLPSGVSSVNNEDVKNIGRRNNSCFIDKENHLVCNGSSGIRRPSSHTTFKKVIGDCALSTDNLVYCWGNNTDNKFSLKSNPSYVSNPTVVLAGEKAKDFGYSNNDLCIITMSDQLKCFGGSYVADGEVVLGSQKFLKLISDSTYSYICAIESINGSLFCYGNNNNGRLGDGNTTDLTGFTHIDSGTGYKMIKISSRSGCGITLSNDLKCWGTGYIGTGSNETVQMPPTIIDSGQKYKFVSLFGGGSGFGNYCAITDNDKLKCWGRNNGGDVGDGTFSNRASPVGIDTSESYKDVWVEGSIVWALTTADELKMWGSNYFFTLPSTDRYINSPTSFFSSKEFSTILRNKCFISVDDELFCYDVASDETISSPDLHRLRF